MVTTGIYRLILFLAHISPPRGGESEQTGGLRHVHTKVDAAVYALAELSEEDAARALAMAHGPNAAWRYIVRNQRWKIEDHVNNHGKFWCRLDMES